MQLRQCPFTLCAPSNFPIPVNVPAGDGSGCLELFLKELLQEAHDCLRLAGSILNTYYSVS